MKVTLVIKIVMLIIVIGFIIMFIIENMEPVPVYMPIIKGKKVGLIFIMFASYITGAITTFLVITRVGASIKKKRRIHELLEEERGELFDQE